MLFPTFSYAVFFALVFFITWGLGGNNKARKLFLIAASWVFYSWWDYRFLGLLILSGTVNWYIARIIQEFKGVDGENPKSSKMWLTISVVFNIGLLGFFKYFNFFIEEFGDILRVFGWQQDLKLMNIVLPVAISFFTFQGLSYVIDVYRGKIKAWDSWSDLLLLTSFFPHLVAGPIVRGADILPQFAEVPKRSKEFYAYGAVLIIWGLFKKTVIASDLATMYVDDIFIDPTSQSTLNLWIGMYAYAIQIYCDFSAYSDIAIGSAALLGYEFRPNFDQPYRSQNLQEFWRRWHISLSTWLRDYLYISLGGNRKGEVRTYFNLFITMVLGGLWHGANLTFVIWGVIHGTILVIERFFKEQFNLKLHGFFGVFITFHIVCFAWIFFRATDFQNAFNYLNGLFGQNGAFTATPYVIGLILIGFAINFTNPKYIHSLSNRFAALNPIPLAMILLFLFIIVDAFRESGLAPFIYFQF